MERIRMESKIKNMESKIKNLLAENDELRERLKNCVNCIIAKEKTIDEITMERILMESKIKNLLADCGKGGI